MIRLRSTNVLMGVACTLGMFAFEARAGSLEILVTETGGPTIPITDNGALDTDPTVGVINANTTLLNLSLVNYLFTDLSSASNSPGGALVAFLVQQGTAVLIPGGTGSVTVLATDVDYSLPAGAREMASSASNTYTNATAGDTDKFQSWFNGSNGLAAKETPSPVVTLTSSAANPNSQSDNAAHVPVSLASPYGLSNEKVVTLTGGAVGATAHDAWTGSTVIIASPIPEPASMSLMLGVLPVIVLAIRRRKAA
jgi:hypothetical protein